MNRLQEIRARLAEIKPEIVSLGEAEEITDEQSTRFNELATEWDSLTAEAAPLEARAARVDAVRTTEVPAVVERTHAPQVIVREDPFEALEGRGSRGDREYRRALVDANLRAIDGMIEDGDNQAHFERTLKRHAMSKKPEDVAWAQNLLARQRPEYVEGFAKLMMGRGDLLTGEERAAVAVGTSANGGYLVPTHLDPTIILTNDGSGNEMRSIARVVTLTAGNIWHGVSSAGVTASYDGELVEVSDDSPTFGNPSVETNRAQSFVQASIEAFEDIAGLGTDVLMLFADARDRLEGDKFVNGSGTKQPRGIVTALDANTNVELLVTTAATIGLVDLDTVYKAVPRRWRKRSTWFMHPRYNLGIKDLGTAVSASYTTDLTQAPSDRILGRPVVESDDAPQTQTTTAKDNLLILGDFSSYVIVDKPGGMSVEFIPHLFNTTTNLPDGRRGWYAYWRNGGNSVNDLAFRLLQDKTTA